MHAIHLACPCCKAQIRIQRVDSEATLRCASCSSDVKLEHHLGSKSRKWLRRMLANDYLTLGDGLYKVDGATMISSTLIHRRLDSSEIQ